REAGLRAAGGDAIRLTHGRLTVALEKGQASRLVFGIRYSVFGIRKPNTEHRTPNAVSLYYNRAFPSAAIATRDFASRTHTMIPDICLEHAGRLLLLDPKFRSYDNADEQKSITEYSGRDYETFRKHPA